MCNSDQAYQTKRKNDIHKLCARVCVCVCAKYINSSKRYANGRVFGFSVLLSCTVFICRRTIKIEQNFSTRILIGPLPLYAHTHKHTDTYIWHGGGLCYRHLHNTGRGRGAMVSFRRFALKSLPARCAAACVCADEDDSRSSSGRVIRERAHFVPAGKRDCSAT